MAQTTEVRIPNIGDFDSVPVIEVLVAEGDAVEKDQPLLVLESDKATMEVPSPAAGVVRGLKVKVGDKVGEGAAVCLLEAPGIGNRESGIVEAKASDPASKPSSEPLVTTSAPVSHPTATDSRLPIPDSRSVTVPNIGDFDSVPVIEVLVAEGDTVEKDQPLLVLESDKATMEVPSPAAGVVRGLKVKVGDKVGEGAPVCELESAEAPAEKRETLDGRRETEKQDAAPPSPERETPNEPSEVPAPGPTSHSSPPTSHVSRLTSHEQSPPYAGPATRKFARQLGVDLAEVSGSGARGRIVIEDVQAYVKQRLAAPASHVSRLTSHGSGIPPLPTQDFSQYGPIETQPLARIRKLSAAHLTRAWLNLPHVTQHDHADITELEAFRKQAGEESGVKLTLLAFVIKAVAQALKTYPEFNSSLAPEGESLILKGYCHIGFAADTPNGLVVPVVREVWAKSLTEIAKETAALAKKAREGKLKPEEMRGGCFSISSLGGIGGGFFTPIVNAPEVAILGVSRAVMQPVWDGQAFQPRLMAPLSLSYDHRVIDGAAAARFIVLLGRLLADVRRMML
jgi:pyruvate dehydrogenase E2 component (dihydrolipoamide acetyltransferase)